MMPNEYAIVFLLSGLISVSTIPFFRYVALKFDITDHPSSRKIHRKPIPYLGGLAFHGSMTGVLIYLFTLSPILLDVQIDTGQLLVLYGIAMAFQLLGIWDDIQPISPIAKLLIQALLSLVLVHSGFTFSQITSPLGGRIQLGWFQWIASVLWILTIVNAINFIDGLDGLAAGVVFFAAFSNFVIALDPWQNFVCLISLVLMGTTLGFLPYNFYPAKIFMGDAGSLYLGVLLAGSSLISNVKGSTAMSLSLPIVILSIPLLDMLLTVVRRRRKGLHLFTADREHIHHRLLRLGFSDKQAVLFLYGLCFLLSMSAILAAQLPNQYTFVFILVFLAAMGWGLIVFSAFERRLIEPIEEHESCSNNNRDTT